MTQAPSLEWITPRHGLADALTALAATPSRVAYLGLSVTAQRDGFRQALHAHLVQRTGRLHTPVNGGVGGVGSVSLTFLMDSLVLAHRPALCFVECTTGDIAGMGKPPLEDVPRSIEGIVRKLLAIGCRPCLLHLYREEVDWRSTHPVVAAYERIADHYQIPSINVGAYLAEAFARGALDKASLMRDVVHLTAHGGAVVAEAIDHAIGWMDAREPGTLSPDARRVPPPLTDGRYDRAREESATPAHCDRPPRTGRFRLLYPYVEVDCSNAIRFESSSLDLKGLFVIVGPDAGPVSVCTPGEERTYDLRDRWTHYDRISTLIFEQPIPARTAIHVRPVAPAASLRTIAFLGLPA